MSEPIGIETFYETSRLEDLLRVGRRLPKVEARGTWKPSFDLRITPSEVAVFVDLPGVDEDDIRIRVQDAVLLIAGERKFDHDKEDAEEFAALGRPYGAYSLEVGLPGGVVADELKARYKRGVLKVQIARG
jgi:HSP20 family protein